MKVDGCMNFLLVEFLLFFCYFFTFSSMFSCTVTLKSSCQISTFYFFVHRVTRCWQIFWFTFKDAGQRWILTTLIVLVSVLGRVLSSLYFDYYLIIENGCVTHNLCVFSLFCSGNSQWRVWNRWNPKNEFNNIGTVSSSSSFSCYFSACFYWVNSIDWWMQLFCFRFCTSLVVYL